MDNPKSQNFPDNTLITPSSEKNALIDSGIHCENLEKVKPDLVNDSLCESVDNELANGNDEAKQISATSNNLFCSSNDNSFETSEVTNLSTMSNTTNNIALLFGRLTLNSAEDTSLLESIALPDNLVPSAISKNQPIPNEASLNDNFEHPNLLNVDINSNGAKIESLQQSPLPDLNYRPNAESKVPLNETFSDVNPVEETMNTYVENLNSNTSKIENSPIFSKNDFDDIFKPPLPVPEPINVPNLLNIPKENVFSVECDDNLEGEEFQDAVQFFKDPSSFQVLENIKTSNLSDGTMPRDSLYMNFDPLYKRVIQPVNIETVGVDESVNDEVCDVSSAKDHLMNKHGRESFGINLVSFDSPIRNISDENSKMDNCQSKNSVVEDNVENDQHLVNKQASDVFSPKSLDNKLAFDSSICSFKKVSGDLSEGEICDVEPAILKSLNSTLEFDSPIKSQSSENSEKVSDDLNEECLKEDISNVKHAALESLDNKLEFDSPAESHTDGNSEKDSGDLNKEMLKKNQFANTIARESLSGNLLSFDSPIKSLKNSEASPLKTEQKLYTEEEFQQALKIYELTMQETYLKKQRELEEGLKQGTETTDKLNRLTTLCKVLLETMTELASVASEQNVKIGELSSRVKNLESENQELDSNLKTSTEDLQSVEHTFSDFHKRYVQCKDMLKTYKDNEDQLKTHIENLSKKLEEQQQMNSMLQIKMGEMVDKANVEVATAKKGGDAQVAVLKAQLKKSELKVSSLENDLKQTRIENDKLSSICDDLMAKVSEV